MVKTLALVGVSRSSDVNGKGYLSFRVIALSRRKSTQSRRDPSFFLTKRTGALNGEFDGRINPVLRFSSMNSSKVFNSEVDNGYIVPDGGFDPSSTLILRSQSRCGGSVSAFCLENTC